MAGSPTEHVEEIHTQPGYIVPTSEENIVELHKTISKIVPIPVNSVNNVNKDSEHPSSSSVLTLKRKRDSVTYSINTKEQAKGYKVLEANISQTMLDNVATCSSHNQAQTVQLREDISNRKGLCERLIVFCKNCIMNIYTFNTSPCVSKKKKNGMIDINLRSVAAATSAGGGLTLLKNVCTTFDFPPPVGEHPYQRYLRYIEQKAVANSERSMTNAGIKLCKHVLHSNFKDEIVVDVPLSFDGSWQKRYGFNSLLGVVLAIYVLILVV